MKCEICHKNEATCVLPVKNGEEADELYVCAECAKAARMQHQKKSQRTRKVTILGDGEEPPTQVIEALMDAVSGMVGEIGKVMSSGKAMPAEKEERPELHVMPCSRVKSEYRLGKRLHLEGLYLMGEMQAVHRAMRALGMELRGVEADGVHEAGHVYDFCYPDSSERARRVVQDLLAQERNARVRVTAELPKLFEDALCRALALLKNCRLLSPAERFDLLSPLRLAAMERLLDGITLNEIELMMMSSDLTSGESAMNADDRDAIDAARADETNARFVDVVLNEKAEEMFQ